MFSVISKTTFHRSLLVLAVLAVSFVMTAPALAVESGGIGGKPANPNPKNPRTDSIFIFTLDSGKQAKDGLQVSNNSDAEKTIDVYAVDSQISSGGAFACAQRVDEVHSVGSWIKLEKDSIRLDPGEHKVIPFSIAVPKDISSGEYNGCVVIQEADQQPTPGGNGIALSFRSAIRVAVTVPGALKKGLFFTRLETHRTEGEKRIISASLKNNGNVSLDTELDISLRSVIGTTVRKTGGTFPILANGESDFNLETTEPFWGGLYFLRAKATYNPDPAAGIGSDNASAAVTKTNILITKPKPVAAVVELVFLIVLTTGTILLLRRRKQHLHWHRHGSEHVVKAGENIQHIAKQYDVPWKIIARINHLKPPYQLTPGDRLKILKRPPAKHKKPIKK